MLTITGLRETAARKGFLLAHAITSGCWRLVDTETGRAVITSAVARSSLPTKRPNISRSYRTDRRFAMVPGHAAKGSCNPTRPG